MRRTEFSISISHKCVLHTRPILYQHSHSYPQLRIVNKWTYPESRIFRDVLIYLVRLAGYLAGKTQPVDDYPKFAA